MSLRLRWINLLLRYGEKPRFARAATPEPLRLHMERSARLTTWSPRGTRMRNQVVTHAGREARVKWINPDQDPSRPVIFHIHGGAFVMGSPNTHRAMLATLSSLTGCSACLPWYRLAPEHPFPAGFDDILTAYQALADHPGGIIIGGDSAGGCLALALLAQILRDGLRRPLGCYAMSPLTDMTFSGASFLRNAEADVLLPADQAARTNDWYLAGHDPKDPRVSPLLANFTGACPVWLIVGSTEILLDDSVRMAEHLRRQAVEVSLEIRPDHPHVWPYFHNYLPEARLTLDDLARWIGDLSSPAGDS